MAAWLAVNYSSGPLAPNPAAYRPVVKTVQAHPTPVFTGPSALLTARLDENVRARYGITKKKDLAPFYGKHPSNLTPRRRKRSDV